MGSSIVIENVCPSQTMIVISLVCAYRQIDSEKMSSVDASVQVSLDLQRVSAGAQAGSCSLVAEPI